MVGACTDVTGFGLVGHASEMATASGVAMAIDTARLPVLPGALRLAAEFMPCGGRANLKFFRSLQVSPDVDTARHLVCLDPQTSGGLLMAVRADAAGHVLGRLADAGVEAATIGQVERRDADAPLVRLE
jgi:selenide,water dikinase